MSGFWVRGRTKPPAGKGVFVVQRLGWAVWGDEAGPGVNPDAGAEGTPLRCFRSWKAAEAYCRELETQARCELSPFRFHAGELELLTSMPEKEFCKALRRLGLTPPAGKSVDWRVWWDAVAADLTDA